MNSSTAPVTWVSIPRGVTSLSTAAVLLTLIGWASTVPHWWAFSFLELLPGWLRLAGTGTILALAYMWPTLQDWSRDWGGGRNWRAQSGVLLLAGSAFAVFREQTPHGDALYKLHLLENTPIAANPYIWKEPLDSLLQYALAGLAQSLGYPAAAGIAALSVLSGLVFVGALMLAARWLADVPITKTLLILSVVGSGSMLLWFGHVENYSGSTAFAFLTLVLGCGAFLHYAPLWAVGLAVGTAVSFHPQAALILPALWLILLHPHLRAQSVQMSAAALTVPLLTAGLLLYQGVPLPTFAQGYAGDTQLFWTPAELANPARLAAILQNLWLIVPLWPIWLFVNLPALRHPQLRRDPIFQWLGTAALCLVIYFVTFQNDLPRWRDWDLYAIVAPPINLWGAYSALRLSSIPSSPAGRILSGSILPAAAMVAAMLASSWIGVNHAYAWVRPTPAERHLWSAYHLQDLTTLLDSASISPATPICDQPENCARVALTRFTMPQTGDQRTTLFAHAPARISLPLTLPDAPTLLWLSAALDPDAWGWGGDGVTFQVNITAAEIEEVLWSRHLRPDLPDDQTWHDLLLPLDAYTGQQVTLHLVTDPGPNRDARADRAGWGNPWLLRGKLDTRPLPPD